VKGGRGGRRCGNEGKKGGVEGRRGEGDAETNGRKVGFREEERKGKAELLKERWVEEGRKGRKGGNKGEKEGWRGVR
jgi:hypothetical protein